jgi:HEPN domain-containing protein
MILCIMPYAHFTRYFDHAARATSSFERNLAHGWHAIAAFELHQVAEIS